ncbi:4'-phosphopantetheinyl transferase superfamily protein [Streptomyces sp. NBC_00249]|uniref:4'-phosphopantetheinyl transferase family protein n=1 Tax=Streptomyces sp. NBC_00249 TaxID=2975690 RepID=UPI00224F5A38|nr:4'-phosphopantetheinyl transferase superfamily protein [Streptomyces sp. NBC_00249]MCX5199457.1 4'-phosphopantetheinyl transferase superfamily protein [Streptomyces sp. NBC_00249]
MSPGEVDLWDLRLPDRDDGDGLLDTSDLDDRERARAARFVSPRSRARYVAAHIALRRVLSTYLGLPAGELAFGRDPCPGCGGPHGRPVLTGSGSVPHFSLSHSRGLAVVAVAATPVGVDVQYVPPARTVERCAPALHPREQTELAAVPEVRRPEAFARLWARKEAYLKGIGTGLSRSPAADYLGDDPRAHPLGWRVHDLTGHPAALALNSSAPPRPIPRTLRLPRRRPTSPA